MNSFSTALAAFILLHIGIAATPARRVLVERLGEWPYRGLFSLASALLLGWMIFGYAAMRADEFDPLNLPFWAPPTELRWATHVLVGAGFLLAVTGLLTPGPTLAGFEGSLGKPDAARGVLRITRHPFLWGVALWGFGHVLSNGERFAPMLFGGLALMALFGARSIDRKSRARDPENWAAFEAVTSNAPFAAILQGRNKLALGEMGWRLLVAIAAFALVGLFHHRLFGAAAFSIQL